MKKLFLIGSLAASALSGIASAGTMGPVVPEWRWLGSVSAGPVWTDNPGQLQTFFLTPEIEKTYVPAKSSSTVGDVELLLGAQNAIYPNLLAQFGLAVGITGNAGLAGIIWDDADPQFDNYLYRYRVQHTHVAAKGKLLADMGYWVMPWVSASIGVGFNDAHSYTNTPLIFEAIENPNFRSHTTTAFTYTVGAGLQKAIGENWQVGAGYEFADWGKSRLGRAPAQTLGQGLRLNHLYTNGVMFNLTYLR